MGRCYVFGCKSRAERKDVDTTFHRFPKDLALQKVWIAATRRETVNVINARICSKHFEEKCFKKTKKLTFLLPGSVPTLFVQTPGALQVQPLLVPHDAAEQAPRAGRPRGEPVAPITIAPQLSTPVRPRGSALPCEPIKVTSGPSTKCQVKITLGPHFNPVITEIKSEADPTKQEEDTQSEDTLSLAEDTDQLSDADQPSEDLIPLSNAQVPLSNAPDPLSDIKIEELEVGVDKVNMPVEVTRLGEFTRPGEVTRLGDVTTPVELTTPVQLTRPVELTTPEELTRAVEVITPVEVTTPVEVISPVEETTPVELTRAVEEPAVPLPLQLKQELFRAGNDCFNLIRIQANQINKLSIRCGKHRQKLNSYVQLVRRRDKKISDLRTEVEALRSFIGERGWEARSIGGGKIDVRRIQIQSSNTAVVEKKPNRQLLIVKRDYNRPKSSVSAHPTSDKQTPSVGVKPTPDIVHKSFLDARHTSDNRQKSSVDVKHTVNTKKKSSVSIPGTSGVLQKSSVGVKRTLNIQEKSSVPVQGTSSIPNTSPVDLQRTSNINIQKSSVGVKRTSDILQKSSSGIPGTSNVVQKSSVGLQRISDINIQKSSLGIRQKSSAAVQPTSVIPQTSSVGFQRMLDIRQNALVIQIDGMHNTVLQPKLVRLADNSMETG